MWLMRRWRRGAWAVISLLLIVSGPRASADSWAPPKTEQFLSADKQTRLTVVPRDMESSFAYFDDKVAGREPAGSRPESVPVKPVGLLEALQPDGGWSERWRRELVNEVAPVGALVSNGGDYVVTFDNWHSVGYGSDVVVIYDAKGKLIRSIGLSDFLSDSHIETLPHSVSSIHWGGQHRLSEDETKLILNVLPPSHQASDPDPEYQIVEVDLATGAIEDPQRNEHSIGALGGSALLVLAIGAVAVASRRRRPGALSQ